MSNVSLEISQGVGEQQRGCVPHPHVYNLALRTVLSGIIAVHSRRKVLIEGAEILREQTGPYILAPVHRSKLDILTFAQVADRTARTQLHFMGKDELWRIPLAGPVFEALGGFAIDRKKTLSTDTVDHIGAIFEKNGVVCMFPEGTRNHGDTVGTIKTGTVRIAATYGVPVVPAGIAGTEKDRRSRFAVVIGEPMTFVGHDALPPVGSSEWGAAKAAVRRDTAELRAAMQSAQDAAIELSGRTRAA